MKKMVVVKPLEPNNDSTQWGVFNTTIFGEFFDDLHRYGLKIAVHNLIWLLKH